MFSRQLGRGKPLPHPTCTDVSQYRGCNTLGVDWGPGGWERENDLPILAGAGGINVEGNPGSCEGGGGRRVGVGGKCLPVLSLRLPGLL